MRPNAANDATTPHNEPIDSNVLNDVQSLWHELRGVIYEHLRLAALETRRAGESLVMMLVAGILVAVLLIGVWLGIMAAGVLMFIEQGMMASTALLFVVVANLLIVLLLCGVIRQKSYYLQFPALLGSLKAMPAKQRTRDEP